MRRTHQTGRLRFVLLFLAGLAACPVAAQDPLGVRVVAYDGMPAPGFPAGTTLKLPTSAGFAIPPAMNRHAQLAFFARLENNSDATLDEADTIWTDAPGTLQAVAIEGMPPAGVSDPGAEYAQLGRRVLIDDTGHVAFNGQWLDSVGGLQQGIWAADPVGSVRRIVTTGMAAPDTPPDHVFASLGFPTNFLNHSDPPYYLGGGRVAFFAESVDDPDADSPLAGDLIGVWSERPIAFARELTMVARTGDDTTFGNDTRLKGINRLGQTILTGSVFPQEDDAFKAIWSENGGILQVVARTNSGAGGDASFTSFGSWPDISAGGSAAFKARFADLPGDANSGIWKQFGQESGVVVTEGAIAPGLPDLSGDGVPDFVFRDFLSTSHAEPLLNASGHLVFRHSASTPDNSQTIQGIWSDVSGGLDFLTLVARVGMQAPGLPAGTEITQLLPAGDWAWSAGDKLAFTMLFEAADGTTGRGLWLWDGHSGGMKPILISVLDPAPGDAVSPDLLSLPDGADIPVETFTLAGGNGATGSGNSDGRLSGFSDSGVIAATLFGDGRTAVVVLNDVVFQSRFDSD